MAVCEVNVSLTVTGTVFISAFLLHDLCPSQGSSRSRLIGLLHVYRQLG